MIDKDIKEVAHFRKKLNGRRLDYDYKRGKLKSGSKGVTDDEVHASYEKLEESIQLGTHWLKFSWHTVEVYFKGFLFYINLKITSQKAGNSMHTLLSNDIEQVNQLYQFMQAMKRYHEEVWKIFVYNICIFFSVHQP